MFPWRQRTIWSWWLSTPTFNTTPLPLWFQLTSPSIVWVRGLHAWKQWQEDHKDLTAPKVPNKDWPQNFQALEELMQGCLGVKGILLAYVIRAELDPTGPPDGTWPNNHDKLIGRTPVRTVAVDGTMTCDLMLIADHTRVWDFCLLSPETWTIAGPTYSLSSRWEMVGWHTLYSRLIRWLL